MEGRSPRKTRRFRVHREFECSRIEQAVLAAAYRKVLPDERLSLVERDGDAIARCNGDGQPDSQRDTNSVPRYVSAIGGH
jgi:hypothetical protein